MAKKQDSFYYENFSECAACACQAAHYLEDALKKMEGILTDQEMAALNYQVEVEERGERDVARAFLASKGLLEG